MGTRLKNRKTGVFAAAAVFTLLSGPAYSQQKEPDSKTIIDSDTLPQNKELDHRYREIMNRQPDGKDAHDPWGSVRNSDVSKPKDDKKHSTTGATSTK